MSLFRFVVRNLPLFTLAALGLLVLASDASAGPILQRIRERRAQSYQGAYAPRSPAATNPAPAATACTCGTACICPSGTPCAAGTCPLKPATVPQVYALPAGTSTCPGGTCPAPTRGFFFRR
jgi:hypothetical protein